jgi:hypothetical protein
MPMDDPGWGDHVPVEDKTTKEPAGRPSRGKGGGFSIGPLNGPTLIGVAAILVIVIVGVVLKFASGGGKKAITTTTQTTQTTIATPVTTSTTTPTTTVRKAKPKPKPKPVTNPNFLPKKTYIKRADAICKAYKPSLNTASSAENVTLFVSLLKKEVGELEKLKPPDRDPATMQKALADAESAIIALQQNDTTTANKYIIATDTLVGVFGMKVCNYGH